MTLIENPQIVAQPHIRQIPISNLRPSPHNARTHSRKQVRQIADSIQRFGFTNPVLIDETGLILAGHGRVEAAKLMGMAEVPCLRFDHMSATDKRAYALADNKLALNAGWDLDLLTQELQALSKLDESGFDLSVTGFETGEIDQLMQVVDEGDDPDDDQSALLPDHAVTQPGDLWHLGRHRVLCADATSPVSYGQLLAGEQAAMVLSDPPYNVPINGHVTGRGQIRHREFAMAAGEMSRDAFTGFLRGVTAELARVSKAGSLHYLFMDWRHMEEILAAGTASYDGLVNLCVWAKTTGGQGSFYRSQHELVFVFRKGDLPHQNNVQLGRYGRNRSNLWTFAGVNTFRKGRMEELASHPTVKPVALVVEAIKDASRRGDIVLDPFLGSGTTLIAAERTGRICHGLEIDPLYVDVLIRRWQKTTGHDAIRASDGERFDSLVPADKTNRDRSKRR